MKEWSPHWLRKSLGLALVAGSSIIGTQAAAPCPEDLPTALSFSVDRGWFPGLGEPSYLDVTVTGGTVFDGFHDGWCVDSDQGLRLDTIYSAMAYCSYDPAIPAGVIGNTANLDEVNWLLNQDIIGTTAPDGNPYTYADFQAAIWILLGEAVSDTGATPPNAIRSDAVVSLALANGSGFIPACDQVVGVLLFPPSTAQTVIIPVPVDCPPPASIGNFVWYDTNGDGVQDAGEAGVPNVTVHLVDCAGNIISSTTTDANGFYLFGGLAAGDYNIQVVPPAGYMFTVQDQGSDNELDSDAYPNGTMDCTTLVAGENDLSWDAGIVEIPPPPKAHIGDRVWYDNDQDGIQDAGEAGVPGVTVKLYDCFGNLVATTTTDADGIYGFDVDAGDYNVVVTVPGGYVVSPQDQGSDDATDSDADSTGAMICTNLTPGETDLTWDAGIYIPADNPGTGTPGYWKNHPEAWPVDVIVIGGITYTKAAAIKIIKKATERDMTTVMFSHLVCAKLNVLIGNDPSCVSGTITDADAWMAEHPACSKVTGSSDAWKEGEPLKDILDDYNNGLLCAPSRD